MTPIVVPELGEDVATATIVEWRKRPGEHVERGEVVLVVESDKAAFEIEAEVSGTLGEILEEAGAEVPVLAAVGYIDESPGRSEG
ncbi:MAG: biotin/lipoyl-containing protein [Planctomycetota bacterium]